MEQIQRVKIVGDTINLYKKRQIKTPKIHFLIRNKKTAGIDPDGS